MTEPYKNPLILTTPHMRGIRVKNAQWLLAGHNVFHDNPSPIHTYYGSIDGVYGESSAGATKRAKFWLGYPADQVNGQFGTLVYNLLHGDSSLSSDYAERRAKRLKAAASTDAVKKKALALAVTQIGTKESPFGSNCQKYGSWYGMNCVPWCAIFVSYCISHSGHQWKYSYVPAIYADAVQGRNGMSITYHPEPGDIVCYTLHGVVDCHTAFFHSWVSDSHQDFYDVGGNTGPVNFSNGGEVLKQVRNVGMVHRFVRLTL